MAKNVFRPMEVTTTKDKAFVLEAPSFGEPEEELEEVLEPGEVDERENLERLKAEAEEFKARFEAEREAMIQSAKAEAEAIVKRAEDAAFEEVRKKTDQASMLREEAEETAKRLAQTAEKDASDIVERARSEAEAIRNQSRESGYAEGRESGYEEGKAEVARLVDRIHVIMDKAIDKRSEIIEQSETQLINLVLLISKKVVKVISENQKNVVINNVIQALRKLKSRGDVVIRVNLSDVGITTEHIQDFMRMIENVKSVTVMEDSTVDKGGCVVETDFGHIDARISSQLHEIEERILDLAPIRIKEGHEV